MSLYRKDKAVVASSSTFCVSLTQYGNHCLPEAIYYVTKGSWLDNFDKQGQIPTIFQRNLRFCVYNGTPVYSNCAIIVCYDLPRSHSAQHPVNKSQQ